MKFIQPSSFKKDVKRQKKRGKDLEKLKVVIEILAAGKDLPQQYLDRSLSGNWNGWRDCHIEPDWILIYQVSAEVVTLGRTGAHSGLF
ncbi:MAG: type II toxin-antitoxin system YafQ family toxin [Akkermansiaceae bacterium]|nr:type II toxin-antitoxin system YafQ family toxin [Akkermansiaceae bacterium]